MAARRRQTVQIGALAGEADAAAGKTEDSAARTHRLLITSMADGHICHDEFGQILVSATETTTHAATTVTLTSETLIEIQDYDQAVEEAVTLIRRGLSPWAERQAQQRRRDERPAQLVAS